MKTEPKRLTVQDYNLTIRKLLVERNSSSTDFIQLFLLLHHLVEVEEPCLSFRVRFLASVNQHALCLFAVRYCEYHAN